jgi:hypothetical protein
MELRLAEFYRAQVREFHENGEVTPAETGLNRPVRVLIMVGDKGDTTVVKFGRTLGDGEEYMRWASSTIYPDHVILVDSWMVERIDMFTPDSMRNRQLADFEPADVDFIALSSPLDSLVLLADNDTLWNIVEPEQAKAKFLLVDQLLRHVDTLAAEIIPAGNNRGYNTPQARLMLKHGDRLLADLVFGDYTGDDIYVRDNKRNMDFLASSAEVAPLNITFKDLADIPVRHVVE